MIEQLNLSSTIWVPAIFNLINLNLISVVVTPGQNATDTSNNSVYELMATAHKALLQPESGMFGYPLFLIMLRNELARCSDGGSPFCLALLEFDQAGYGQDRLALSHISSSFDSIRRIYDVIAFAMPKHCYVLMPQTNRGKSSHSDSSVRDSNKHETRTRTYHESGHSRHSRRGEMSL